VLGFNRTAIPKSSRINYRLGDNMTEEIRIPEIAPSYPAGSCKFTVDKTGTLFFFHVGRLIKDGPWGYRLYRVPSGGNPELVWFGQDCNADISIFNNQLWVGYCNNGWKQRTVRIPGYIGWGDSPSGQIVKVDESALASVRASITASTKIAESASGSANTANKRIDELTTRINNLEAKVNNLQANMLSRSTVEDIVWSKIWDINYLIRMGFIEGKSSIQQVQDYLNDLTTFIKRVIK